MVLKINGNYFTRSIEKQVAEAIEVLGEQVPEILEDSKEEDSQWKALLKVAEIYHNNPAPNQINKHARYWIMIKGQNVIWNNSEKLTTEEVPFNFYADVISLSDWPLVKNLLLSMPTEYVEKYLMEEIPTMNGVQHSDYYKIFSERTDEWGQYPASWIQKVYGVRKSTESDNNG